MFSEAIEIAGKDRILRCHIIPSLNYNESHFEGKAAVANSLTNIKSIDIEPHHAFGLTKLDRLEKSDGCIFDVPDSKAVEKYINFITGKTDLPVKLG